MEEHITYMISCEREITKKLIQNAIEELAKNGGGARSLATNVRKLQTKLETEPQQRTVPKIRSIVNQIMGEARTAAKQVMSETRSLVAVTEIQNATQQAMQAEEVSRKGDQQAKTSTVEHFEEYD